MTTPVPRNKFNRDNASLFQRSKANHDDAGPFYGSKANHKNAKSVSNEAKPTVENTTPFQGSKANRDNRGPLQNMTDKRTQKASQDSTRVLSERPGPQREKAPVTTRGMDGAMSLGETDGLLPMIAAFNELLTGQSGPQRTGGASVAPESAVQGRHTLKNGSASSCSYASL